MFNERFGLQQATFDGTKTMTRRVVPDKTMKDALAYQSHHIDDEKAYEKYILDHAPYKVGEIVAIAQRYVDIIGPDTTDDFLKSYVGPGCMNKMFVKAEYMPHHIKITGIRVEGLAGIGNGDCMREGIREIDTPVSVAYTNGVMSFAKPYDAFKDLIDRLNHRGFFESNPLVYAYTYELVD